MLYCMLPRLNITVLLFWKETAITDHKSLHCYTQALIVQVVVLQLRCHISTFVKHSVALGLYTQMQEKGCVRECLFHQRVDKTPSKPSEETAG